MGLLARIALGVTVGLALAAGCNDAGSDAVSTPTPPPPTGAPFVDVCAKAATCMADGSGWLASVGFWCWMFDTQAEPQPNRTGLRAQLGVMYGCIEAAEDCAQVRACIMASEQEMAACSSGTNYACSGDTLVACNDLLEDVAYDCTTSALSCGSAETGACCGIEPCDPSAGEQPRCEGDLLVTCDARCGMFVHTDCRYWCGDEGCQGMGGVCGTTAAGTPGCVGTGAPCEVAGSDAYCEGSTYVLCLGGRESEFDCAANSPSGIELDCVPEQGCRAGTECDFSSEESCEGAVARVCVENAWQEVDCLALGFSGCMADNGAAACVP